MSSVQLVICVDMCPVAFVRVAETGDVHWRAHPTSSAPAPDPPPSPFHVSRGRDPSIICRLRVESLSWQTAVSELANCCI